jgi:hypothetical protein
MTAAWLATYMMLQETDMEGRVAATTSTDA